ncbi:hypothetical protein P9E76_00375 [Schinkia azotoformans]|uniref:Uncharacterized protein n=1 Tax=Schinkia azotoformans LMG 9581 TaxID=1131731 RepID=K6DCZ0_SCHAZ|nr:hypothetical protein [Schinkia azotoformans]EKN70407.1 hypothetical protein BAZO_01377 [Schinkia azotoformans LMG 9581]MEC1640103.1 hypothetical protein [Schinkia azotoformans]MEC1943541.1 hypothetical protein [Schinkia azotoformans]MED4354093.1 hypothetical protein [Schinkia azotoformans]
MIFSIMNKLIKINSFDKNIYIAEKELYCAFIQQICDTAKEDKVPEVVVYLEKLNQIVQNHKNIVKDSYIKLEKISDLFKGHYKEVKEITSDLPDDWKNHSLSYGYDEIIFIKSKGFDKLYKMDTYHLLVFKVIDNSLYKFNKCYIGFSNKDIEPYTNFSKWMERKIFELEQCKDLNTLTSTFSSIKSLLINIYRVKKIYDLVPDVKSYGLPSSSEVLTSFNKKYNQKKNEIYLINSDFNKITDDLLTLVSTIRKHITLKDEQFKEIFGEGYDIELKETEKKVNNLVHLLQINENDLLNLKNVIMKNEEN